jgi:DNA repair ATPase RecN
MARYIEREKFLKKCAEAWGYAGVTIKAIEQIADECTTAEVVQNSECDKCQERVLKDFDDLRDFYGKQIDYLLSKNDELKQENESLKDNNEHLAVFLEESKQAYANYEETTGLKQAKQAYAKEIISEMDNRLHNMAMEYANRGHKAYFAVCEMVHHKVIRPVEKKYAEGD